MTDSSIIEFEFEGKPIVFNIAKKENKTLESRHLYGILELQHPELFTISTPVESKKKKKSKSVEPDYDKITDNCLAIIPVMKNYCIGCHEPLEFQGETFTTCGKQKCIIATEELLLDNFVIQYFKDNEPVAIFLLESAYFAMGSPRREQVFEPFPKMFLFNEDIGLERGKLSSLTSGANVGEFKNNKNFPIIDKIRSLYQTKELINICNKTSTDYELSQIVGDQLYPLLKFIMKSNQTSMKPVGLFTMLDFNKFMQYQYSASDKRAKNLERQVEEFRQFEVSHHAEIEDAFRQESKQFGTIFLYHGSSIENWYSIMRNGLKITSGTQLMTTGAAYGHGIYLSSDINISIGYARGDYPTFGVYEVINDRARYHQAGVIFVAKDEKMMILRYLFVLPSTDFLYTFSLQNVMNQKFNISLHNEKKQLSVAVNNIKSKRLLAEYKKLAALDAGIEGFYVVIPDENNFYLWNIFINRFEGSRIEEDMRQLQIAAIQMDVQFPDAYPLEPPFIRIIYPRFLFRTGHITSGGSICMEILTKKGWSSVCSMEALIRDIKANIIEGEGQIDHDNYFKKYTIEEAKDAFNRMARTHGWE